MDLKEFGLPPDLPADIEAETVQPFLYPLDWDELTILPPMLTAAQSTLYPTSMHVHSVPSNDTHPKTTSSSHRSAFCTSTRAPRPKPPPGQKLNPKPTEDTAPKRLGPSPIEATLDEQATGVRRNRGPQ